MIDGFTQSLVEVGDVRLSVHRAGRGAPLVLLHGYPQNHRTWANVAPEFAKHFDVIVPDLRGYGGSDAPTDNPDSTTYSKRIMAADIVGLMDKLSLPKVHILGHDRGARVAYRFALDHPERLDRLGIIEIMPTGDFWQAWTAELAMKAYHWTFLAQPAPLPERLIGGDPQTYLDWTLRNWTLAKSLDCFPPESLASYRDQMRDPARLHAMCADYRAGAGIDRALDDADLAAGRKITAPLAFLWSDGGFPAKAGNPLAIWQKWATSVSGESCVAGHFVMEENPAAVLSTFLSHFTRR